MLRHLSIAILASVAAASAGQESPVIRTTTRMVEVHVLVQDKHGKPIPDLTKADFVLKDRGKPQKITAFATETNRTAAPPPNALPPGVFSNLMPRGAAPPSSATVVLVDRLNTRAEDQNFAREQLIKFLKQSGPQDRLAIVALGTDLHILAGFNSTQEARLKIADAERGRDSALLDMSEVPRADPGSFDDKFSRMDQRTAEVTTVVRVERTLRALDVLARHLSRLPGRKNLVWISGAFPFSMNYEAQHIMDGRRTRLDFSARAERTARALTDANVAVYPVDARGLTGAPMADTAASMYDFDDNYRDGTDRPDSVMLTQQSMKTLAESTGGKAYQGSNDIGGAIRQAIDDSTLVYVLGYQPSHGDWNGKFRPIEVQVDREGAVVRHRRGYFAYAEDPEKLREASLLEACSSPLESTGVGLVGSAAAPEGKRRKITVLADAQSVTLESRDKLWSGALDVLIVQQSAEGKDLNVFKSDYPLHFTQPEFETALQGGIRLVKTLEIDPAAVRVRVAVRDRASGKLGTLSVPLDAR